jgi:hypothetical protein
MNRKMASVTPTAFLRTEEKFPSVGLTEYVPVGAHSGFLKHVGLQHLLQFVRAE